MSKSKAETLCSLIDELDIRGKAELIKIITDKMLVENMYKGLDERTSKPRIKLTNKRLAKDVEKIFLHRSNTDVDHKECEIEGQEDV